MIFKNLVHIPNFVIESEIDANFKNPTNPFQFVIAVGRLNNDVKQFDKLIKSYRQSDLIKNNIRLFLIFGDGKDKNQLENLIIKRGFTRFSFFRGFQSQSSSHICQCLFYFTF